MCYFNIHHCSNCFFFTILARTLVHTLRKAAPVHLGRVIFEWFELFDFWIF